MEPKKEPFGMLDLMIQPAFSVKENIIQQVNAAAEALLITPGTDVRDLLRTGKEEYAAFQDGCLHLTLNLSAKGCGACLRRIQGYDVFTLDPESEEGELRALSLAARELREPLTSVMVAAERLLPSVESENKEQAARLNRALHQMLRLIGNMSDAGRANTVSRQETRNLPELFGEIFEKAQSLVQQAGIRLTYQGLQEEILCLADGEQLERAVLNILSNAIKFTPKGGVIHAQLTRSGKMLYLRIADSGSGLAEPVRSTVFSRYLRQPGIEDSRYGLGLGMVLIRSAAAAHGGTVLLDQPEGIGARVTMTLAIRQNMDTLLRSPVLRVDYAGERNHGLIELADCLPLSAYEKEL